MADAKEPTGEELRAIAYRFTGSSDDIEQFRNCYRAGIAADKASREQQRGPRPSNPHIEPEIVNDGTYAMRAIRKGWGQGFEAGVAWAESGKAESVPTMTSEADVERLAVVAWRAWQRVFSNPETLHHGNAYHWQCAVHAVLAELAKGTVGK